MLKPTAMSFLLVLAGGCSQPATMAAVSALRLSTSELYAKLMALPATGPKSQQGIFNRVAALSFPEYYRYLVQTAAAEDVQLDQYILANPRRAVEAQQAEFTAMAAVYPTVGDWWQDLGFRPKAFASEGEFRTSVAAAVGNSLSLDIGGSCDGFFIQGQQPTVPLSGVGGAANGYASRFGLASHTNARRAIAARRTAAAWAAANQAADNGPDSDTWTAANQAADNGPSGTTMEEPPAEPGSSSSTVPPSPTVQLINQWRAEGKSNEEIQGLLAKTWQNSGPATPTPTPTPPSGDMNSFGDKFSCLRVNTKPGG